MINQLDDQFHYRLRQQFHCHFNREKIILDKLFWELWDQFIDQIDDTLYWQLRNEICNKIKDEVRQEPGL